MKKRFISSFIEAKFLIARCLTLLILALLSTNLAWGVDESITALTFPDDNSTKNKVSDYVSTWIAKNTAGSWTIVNFNNNSWNGDWKFIRVGNKNAASEGTITSPKITDAVKKVNVTIDALTASKVNSIKLLVSSDNSTFEEVGSFTASTGVQSVSISSPEANKYYRIAFNCQKGSSNGLVTVSKVELFKAGVSMTPATIKFKNTESQNLYVGQTFQNVAKAYDEGGNEITSGVTISYVSSNTEKATVSEDGTVNVLASSTQPVNITASLTSDTYEADPVSYSMNLSWKYTTKPEITATSVEGGYLRESDNTFNGKINVLITRPANMAKLYYTTDESDPRTSVTRFCSDNASVELSDIEKDITVKAVFADADGCYGYTTTAKYIHSAGVLCEVTYSINGAETSSNYFAGESLTFPSVQPFGGKVFRGWVTETIEGTTDTEPVYVNTTDLTATQSITYYAVFAKATEELEEKDVTYTFTSKSWADATSSWTSGKDGSQYTTNQGVQVTSGVTGANATSKSAFTEVTKVVVNYCTNTSKGEGTILVKVGEGTAQSYSVSAPSSGGTTLRNTDDMIFENETGNVNITVECGTNSIYINSITITSKVSTTSYSDYCTIVPRTFTKTISDRKMATLYLDYAVEIPEDVKAYTAADKDDSHTAITLEKITDGVIPANTGVIIYSDIATDYTFTETTDAGSTYESNCLKGVTDKTVYDEVADYDATAYNYYALMADEGTSVVFKLVSAGSYAANSAYLVLPKTNAAKVDFTFGDEPTGIESLTPALSEGKGVYNLQGVRVNNGYKGIVIMNGKKYINK